MLLPQVSSQTASNTSLGRDSTYARKDPEKSDDKAPRALIPHIGKVYPTRQPRPPMTPSEAVREQADGHVQSLLLSCTGTESSRVSLIPFSPRGEELCVLAVAPPHSSPGCDMGEGQGRRTREMAGVRTET